jgi:ubiquinone/menaquinone biosynthesis C-methylase UbiE
MSEYSATLEPLWRQFQEARLKEGNLNDHLDLPALLELIPDGNDRRALDLGCGLGQSSFRLAERKGYFVTAVDGNAEMLEQAQKLYTGTKITWVESTFEKLDFQKSAFDLIVSCLSLHFVADLEPLIKSCAKWLAPGGVLAFSVRHPLRTANPVGEIAAEQVTWSVKDYMVEGPRHFEWLGSECVNFHRPLSTYLKYILNAGLIIQSVSEPSVVDQKLDFSSESRSVPFILTIAARKPF